MSAICAQKASAFCGQTKRGGFVQFADMTQTLVTDQLKALRVRAALSVRGMAALLGMSSSGYLHYETAERFKDPYLPLKLAEEIAEILKPRGVNSAEVLALAGIAPGPGGATTQPVTPLGFAEDHALPWRGQGESESSAMDLCRAVAPSATNPGPYEVRKDMPLLGLFSGDIVVVDRMRLPVAGQLALGNARDADGNMFTVIGRFFPPHLVTVEAMSRGTALLVDGDSVVLYHPIVASFRRN